MKFTIYSKKGCAHCTNLKNFLKKNSIEFDYLILGEDFSVEEFRSKFSQPTFPQVIHNSKSIGGLKETIRYLVENKFV